MRRRSSGGNERQVGGLARTIMKVASYQISLFLVKEQTFYLLSFFMLALFLLPLLSCTHSLNSLCAVDSYISLGFGVAEFL